MYQFWRPDLTKHIKFEAIIFDIDGVLVDVKRSYNGAIIKTVQIILEEIFNIRISSEYPFEVMISKLRNTGGFNNDIDTTYAIILILLYCVLVKKMDYRMTMQSFEDIIIKLDEKGNESLEKELEKDSDIQDIKEKLNYPNGTDDIISTRFNEIFYGSQLFKVQFNKEPTRHFEDPLIDNDMVIMKEETIRLLSRKFGANLGLISGRSRVASQYTLGKLFHYFNDNACVFLEDERREHSKPNTFSLHQVFHKLNLKNALYVGDSIADLLMVENFRNETRKDKIYFCGIYGEGYVDNEGSEGKEDDNVEREDKVEKNKQINGQKSVINTAYNFKDHNSSDKQNVNRLSTIKKELFSSKNADVILENVNDLPNILNITKN